MPIAAAARIDLGQTIGQFRATPVRLGPDRPHAICALYSEDAEIDPYIGMFFFPKHTLKLVMFDEHGTVMWTRDLGTGVVPGVWFSPVLAFDLDGDGVDEIWIITNTDPAHPMDYRTYVLERVDPFTGQMVSQSPWVRPAHGQSMSHSYRHFLVGGHVKGEPLLVAANGTYGPMSLRAYTPEMSVRWQYDITRDRPGASGSHVCPVVDIDGDGSDELMWGERCIRLDDGTEMFCADSDSWNGHTDIVQPVLDPATGRWRLHTLRESASDTPPRIVSFDDSGRRVWTALDSGHMDTGWAARLERDAEPVVLGVRVGKKVRSAEGEHRFEVEEFACRAFSGEPVTLPFAGYTTIPVDIDGDGLHEFVRGYFQGNGEVLDADGTVIGQTHGLCAMASKFTSLPGEQILSYAPDGTVTIWHDPDAVDTDDALLRYAHPFYAANRRLTGVGYNLFNLGGL